MKWKVLFSILLALMCHLQAAANNLQTTGTFFHEITDNPSSAKKQKITTKLIKNPYYQCGREDHCNFISQNLKTQKVKKINSKDKADLPTDTTDLHIWEKDKQGFKNCKDAKKRGIVSDGIYDMSWENGTTFKAYCDMATKGGGWTVFQRRVNGDVSFDRSWNDYVNGFGDLQGSYWLGLEALHHLTQEANVTLRIELKHSDEDSGFGEYEKFRIANADTKYRITFGRFEGTIGNSMTYDKKHNTKNMMFTTKGNDNDRNDNKNCAISKKGGWWYKDCSKARLNAPFSQLRWKTWKKGAGNITFSEMKLRTEH
eukprot:Seg1399.3 transcript_id=Seg1399.3/GoldUCD/mRNA.D3Y31 product=Ficolin-1 protein_id=Seg1399.3/GoldUCD/D3Y31